MKRFFQHGLKLQKLLYSHHLLLRRELNVCFIWSLPSKYIRRLFRSCNNATNTSNFFSSYSMHSIFSEILNIEHNRQFLGA